MHHNVFGFLQGIICFNPCKLFADLFCCLLKLCFELCCSYFNSHTQTTKLRVMLLKYSCMYAGAWLFFLTIISRLTSKGFDIHYTKSTAQTTSYSMCSFCGLGSFCNYLMFSPIRTFHAKKKYIDN